MGLIKHFFVINSRGNPIIIRAFLDETNIAVVEDFYQRLTEEPPPPPIFRLEQLTYCWVNCAGLYFVVATPENMSPSTLELLLRRITVVLSDYLGKCTELSIQKNLALCYEVVDEVLSFGCPQATDSSMLLHLVHNEVEYDQNFLTTFLQTEIFPGEGFDRPLALKTSERTKTNNEIFIVLSEKLSLTLTAQGNIINSNITGLCTVKSFLQSVPSCVIQLDSQAFFKTRNMPKNLLYEYDDITFAPYALTNSFDSDRSISFCPPQGSSLLFTYRTTRPPSPPPFTVVPYFENTQPKVVVVRVAVTSTFPVDVKATDVSIIFQCPVETSSASCELPQSVLDKQSSEFDSKNRQVVWRIKEFGGLAEYNARFRFIFDGGIPGAAETLLGPIAIDFTIAGPLPSGLSVKNFIVSTQGTSNEPHKWMKEITQAGSYTFNFI
ncbi:Adaptor complexes medium subunit family protein [Trichomonas vaginalis G3]|uniref:Adaptor complexes medium subunit family protein n=1 Tax=Trichomonas vaginalis (strain ATCC PRA-98 / G3) TaxID=412133 RepID=A2EHB1_TRIV3|nr:vesicle-mediated transport [Trichomonas vaginalis G3]EAY07990.1 Adaptor complexes medium subunit family protein [Trichomonas vaginalis G3]KAI5486036.1 vesicle-mediated transport [Trichomonas vaginalis G3]|eukprot:XP_001320213.1 Adaptor complexes medium subunit family protein [Trichomonas vaginalis G3]